jgi:carbohydrate-selective porin OprB
VVNAAVIGTCLVVFASTASAQAVDPCACSPNKPGFHRASALTGDWNGVRSDWFDDGIKIQGTYAGELFAGPGLDDDRVVAAGLAVIALDLDLATLVGDRFGSIHVAGLGIHGGGLSERLMDVYGVSNNVAAEDVRLFEAWIEQPIGPFTLRTGLLSADQEFILASHSTVLLNATFGIVAMLSTNIGNPVYPVATPGASARVETDEATIRAAVYGDQHENRGIPQELGEDVLAIGELELWGTFKLGGWHHTEKGSGYYAIVDRQLERYIGTFTRVSVAPDKPIELYVDAGVRIGPGPLRPRDFASLGLAFARSELGPQTVVEATYQYLATGWLTIQPDAQVLLTRNGTEGVVAVRAVIAL